MIIEVNSICCLNNLYNMTLLVTLADNKRCKYQQHELGQVYIAPFRKTILARIIVVSIITGIVGPN